MRPQHRRQRIRSAPAPRLRVVRTHHGLHLLPRNQPIHPLQELLPTRLPLLPVLLQLRERSLRSRLHPMSSRNVNPDIVPLSEHMIRGSLANTTYTIWTATRETTPSAISPCCQDGCTSSATRAGGSRSPTGTRQPVVRHRRCASVPAWRQFRPRWSPPSLRVASLSAALGLQWAGNAAVRDRQRATTEDCPRGATNALCRTFGL